MDTTAKLIIFGSILFTLVVGILVLIPILKWKSNMKKEEQAFNNLLSNPSDRAVYQYIPLFLAASKAPIIRPEIENFDAIIVGNKLRQSQGYQIIMQSSNVSDKAKEDLKRAFISKGVIPIQ